MYWDFLYPAFYAHTMVHELKK